MVYYGILGIVHYQTNSIFNVAMRIFNDCG
jgi:hypothetical protein